MASARFNQGKPQLGFLLQFPTAMEAFARVKEMGAIKYDRDNWKLGGKPDWEYLDAVMRHLTAHAAYLAGEGEYFAEDTGCSHLAHAAWNMFALQELNYEGSTHDPELFAAMAKYWAEEKERKAKEEPVADHPPIKVSVTPETKLWERNLREQFRDLVDILKREIKGKDDPEEST